MQAIYQSACRTPCKVHAHNLPTVHAGNAPKLYQSACRQPGIVPRRGGGEGGCGAAFPQLKYPGVVLPSSAASRLADSEGRGRRGEEGDHELLRQGGEGMMEFT